MMIIAQTLDHGEVTPLKVLSQIFEVRPQSFLKSLRPLDKSKIGVYTPNYEKAKKPH
jgi:hypothetical protein